MDQLRSMTVFAAVVDRGSFAAAASHLGLSRTAASKLVMELEAHLGVTLLNRTTRTISLTRPGTAYYERAKRILDEIDEADREAGAETLSPRGRVLVSAPMSFGVRHLAPRLKTYLDANPDVQLDLFLSDSQVDFVREGFDLTIRIGKLANSGLIARKIGTTRSIFCAAESYLRDRGTPMHPRNLEDHACLGYPYWRGQNSWEVQGPDAATITVDVDNRIWCNNGDALVAAASGGLGIILQPDFLVHDAIERGELVQILDDYRSPEMGIYVLFMPNLFLPSRVRSFIDFLAQSFAEDMPWRSMTRTAA